MYILSANFAPRTWSRSQWTWICCPLWQTFSLTTKNKICNVWFGAMHHRGNHIICSNSYRICFHSTSIHSITKATIVANLLWACASPVSFRPKHISSLIKLPRSRVFYHPTAVYRPINYRQRSQRDRQVDRQIMPQRIPFNLKWGS